MFQVLHSSEVYPIQTEILLLKPAFSVDLLCTMFSSVGF